MKNSIFTRKITVFLVCCSIMLFMSPTTWAANSFAYATSIQTGVPYRDNLENSSDVNFYKVDLSSAGKLYVNFSHDQVSSGSWKTTLYDAAFNELTYFYTSSSEMTQNSFAVRLPAGTYYIKVASNGFNNADYKITANFLAEGDSFEKEPNNSMQTANRINPGNGYTGNLSTSSDVDYYQLDLSFDVKLKVNFSHDQVTGGSWKTTIYDSASKELTYYYANSSEMTKDSNSLRLSAGKYYIKVASNGFNNADYKITADISAEGDSFEKEPNNSMQHANPISLNKDYTGNLSSNSDLDYYQLNMSSAVKAKVNISHDQVASGSWKTTVYDSTGKELKYFYTSNSELTKHSQDLRLSAGTYYVKVSSNSFNNSDYRVKVIIEEDTTTNPTTPTQPSTPITPNTSNTPNMPNTPITTSGPTVFLNGNQLVFDVPPMIINGRTLVPLRKMFESLGAEVDWVDWTRTVTAIKGDTIIKLQIGSNTAYINGSATRLDVPSQLIMNRTFVPLRFVSEALGAKVAWDGLTQNITIKL